MALKQPKVGDIWKRNSTSTLFYVTKETALLPDILDKEAIVVNLIELGTVKTRTALGMVLNFTYKRKATEAEHILYGDSGKIYN